VRAFAEAARDGASVAEIEARADECLAGRDVVELEPVAGERLFTTSELLELEGQLLARAGERRREGVGLADHRVRDAAIAARPSLSGEQRELVVSLTGSGHGVEVVRAPAGTGKTFALDAARETWQASEIPVLGCALSARAACELRDQAGLDATTIARLRHALSRSAALAPGSVLIVDEAGMVGTRDLAALADAADAAGAKLVLVGDDRQLPEIEAGGAFPALADRLGAIELTEVRRQREAWDRDALAELRHGQIELFAREYHQHGRLVSAPSAERAREALVDDWFESHQRGEHALMIAHRRRDVADLNARARKRLRDAGRLGPDELEVDDRGFAIGDRVVTTRNDRALDVVNGHAGRLAAIEDGRLKIERDDRTIDIPDSYARDGHLDHAYASTAHRAQGATVDRTFVLGSDELYREWGYTALSRHRDEARFYISASPDFLNRAPEPLTADEDLAGHVTSVLMASRSQQLALDGYPRDHEARFIAADLEHAREHLAENEARLDALQEERAQTRWYQRARRQRLDRVTEGHQRGNEYWHAQVDRLTNELAERQPVHDPALPRAHDPLAMLEPPELDRARRRGLERDLGRDSGMDIGLD
jgi:ATP-dependent exoDNAse (exonuclease V) alpha subunit